ncbi:MAG: phosphoenolpyruvate--protein phosphotransferase [Pirellulales bacterium]|nr:phosphoenolpyruvate--protein phosphotransferase [Pirellulales bacterium]
MRKGLPVSPGVAVGTAYCIHEIFWNPRGKPISESEVDAEQERYERAVAKTSDDLEALHEKVASQVGQKEADIFRVHLAILHDPTFHAKVRDWIVSQRSTASAALHHVLNDFSSLFARTKDEYLKQRLADVRDVIERISGHLTSDPQPDQDQLQGPFVVIADELLPSHVVTLGNREVIGIVTQAGGQTSHAAILARGRGIPAVAGVRGILKQVSSGATIVVDGREGLVMVNPDSETESAYRKLQREFFHLKDHLAENHDQPAVTADGESVELLANINSLGDAQTATNMGASGVGLYRTEYLFLTHPDVPSEDEQYEAYRQIIDASPGNRVTLRTLDLGGDKTIPYLGHRARSQGGFEANPFLGWRSIRLSFEHPEFFMTQVRAVLRAAARHPREQKNVRLMFPMITTLEEMRRVRIMVRRAQKKLKEEGVPAGRVQLGLMLEVPAAAVSIESFLDIVDFVSIGSNDLVQYLMAADRDNPKVSHLCQPLAPAVLKVLSEVIRSCRQAGRPVTLCGEMAGSPKAFVMLFAMGLRSFSMSPAFIPSIKLLASHLTLHRARMIYRRAMRFDTTRQVRRFLAKQVHDICPSVELLDSV